eukprot:jgi/Psemu1/284961/fgenesh1_pg.69_\
MGGTFSFSLGRHKNPQARNNKDEDEERKRRKQQLEEKERQRRKRLLENYGVLIPPVFVANHNNEDAPVSVKAHQTVRKELSLMAKTLCSPFADNAVTAHFDSDLLLWAADQIASGPALGERLLEEYMRPGLFVSLPIAANLKATGESNEYNNKADNNSIQAAVLPPPSSSQTTTSEALSSLPSFVSLTKSLHPRLRVEGYLSQPVWLSSIPAVGESGLPWSMRLVADLSRNISRSQSKSNRPQNETRLTWTSSSTNYSNPSATASSGSSAASMPESYARLLSDQLDNSWIEAEAIRPNWYRSGINVKLASGLKLDSLTELGWKALRKGNDWYQEKHALESNSNVVEDYFRRRNQRRRNDNIDDANDHPMRFRMAAECCESILAASARIPISDPTKGMATDTLVSINLNGQGSGSGGDTSQPSVALPPLPPPLWLTLKQSNGIGGGGLASSSSSSSSSCWTLNLAQVVAFDRDIWNILEERAPRIRNHIGWVCQVERRKITNSNGTAETSTGNCDSNSNSNGNLSSFALGASAQFNRNLAVKAVVESTIHDGSLLPSVTPSSSTVTNSNSNSSTNSAVLKVALVFKRWLQPRASLSVIHAIDLRTGKSSFLGLGVEVEQSSNSKSNRRRAAPATRRSKFNTTTPASCNHGEYRDAIDVDSGQAPPTRVQVQLPPGAGD